MSTIKRSKTDAFDTKQSVNIVKLAEAAFEQVSLDDLTDVVVDNPTDGDILVYNESLMAWENVPQMEFASNLGDLGDITITSVSDGQVLTYDSGTSKWINANPVTGVTTLDGLSDVVITTASTGQVLKYNGTNWVNATDGSTPAGSDTYVQFNDGGSLGGSSDLTFNKVTGNLTVQSVSSSNFYGETTASSLNLSAGENETLCRISLTPGNLSPSFVTEANVFDIYHEGNLSAEVIPYDNTTSGLTATNVKDAIDEVAASSSGGSAPAGGYHPSPLLYAPGGYKFIPGKLDAGVGTNQNYSASVGKVTLIPFVAPRNMTVTDMSVYSGSTTGAGTAYSLGIYSSGLDGNIDIPGTLLDSATGTIIATAANTLTINATLTAGSIYWAALGLSATTNLNMIVSGSDYSAFGHLFAAQGGGNYAYIAATSTIPSSVASGDLGYQPGAGNMPCIWIGWEPA